PVDLRLVATHRLDRRQRADRVVHGCRAVATLADVAQTCLHVLARAGGLRHVAVRPDGRVLVPPLALALGVDGRGGSDGSVSGLVGLVVASERDGTNGAVATTRVRAAPVERHA